MAHSNLEEVLAYHLDLVGAPAPERQRRVQAGRRWAFDFAWPHIRLAVEVEGGIWLQTSTGRGKGHASPSRFVQDCLKYNAAAINGWTVLRYTPDRIGSFLQGGDAALEILEVIRDREAALQGDK